MIPQTIPEPRSRRVPKLAVEPIDPPRGSLNRHGSVPMPAFDVYFILGCTSGLVKIGYAKHAWSRLSNLQTGSPEPLKLIGVIETYLPLELEGDLHAHFAADRVRGEWFKVSDELIRYVERFGRYLFDGAP